jgi:hypothetical protein
MPTIRRVYVLLVAAIGLAMLVFGLVRLGGTIVDLVAGATPLGASVRSSLATATALALVGLAAWLLHWRWAQRQAASTAEERASTLRRLYVYGVSAVLLIGVGVNASDFLALVFGTLDAGHFDTAGVISAAWRVAVFKAFWLYHLQVAAQDRAAVGERGGAATLRRWYGYGLETTALVIVLFATREVLSLVLDLTQTVGRTGVADQSGLAIGWLGVWIWQVRRNGRVAGEADRESTLRPVSRFLVVALAVTFVLVEAHQILYQLLARALGVPAPGGVAVLDLATLAHSIATLIVFGAAWALMRVWLGWENAQEPDRQGAVRRLYRHLVAFLAMVALGVGLTGLLVELGELLPSSLPRPPDVDDQLARFVSMSLVALGTWLMHWRVNVSQEEQRSLSRRLYVFATVAVSVIALLIGAVALAETLVNGLLGGDPAALERMRRPAAMVLVPGLIAAYHWRVLRADAAARATMEERPAPEPEPPETALVVEIAGATEAEVAAALSALPAGARYAIRR